MYEETERMSEPILLRCDADAVATLTLNRPAQRNALSRAMIAALSSVLDDISQDPSIRAVVIAANGPGYCAGHDLKEVRANPDRAFYDLLFAECSALMTRIVRLPQPVIACVHGIATAAGCQLVASCDLAMASEDARFATPGVNIGLFCSTPMVALSRAVSRKHAMEMLLTGELMDAGTAWRFGLVNRVVPAADLRAETHAVAANIAGKSGATVRIGKEAFYRQLEMRLDEAYDYASGVIAANMEMRDAEEGINAFIDKRAPVWRHG